MAGLLFERRIRISGGEEGDIQMKKIVILSDHSDHIDALYNRVLWLNTLFPECEIEVRMVSPTDDGLQFDGPEIPSKLPETKEFAR
jgi:hypothetical protein